MYYIASFSGGKDSTAMVLKLIQLNYPLDEIVFYDNGMEFKATYNVVKYIFSVAKNHDIKCTTLTCPYGFLYKAFDKVVNHRDGTIGNGYSWCGGICRWGTTDKLTYIDKYCQNKNAKCYVGIAFDEQKRLEKERKAYKLFPMADWKMSETQALQYCYEKGINWNEPTNLTESGYIDLYTILDRVSCWCCANKNLYELRNIWFYLHDTYWQKLKEFQSKTDRPMKKKGSVFELEKLFENGYKPRHILKLP